jgi:hypothetical protein
MKVIIMIIMDIVPTALMNLGVAVTAVACLWMLVTERRRNPLVPRQPRCMNLFPPDRSRQPVPRVQIVANMPVQMASVAALYARKPAAKVAAATRLQPGLTAPIRELKPHLAMAAAVR